MPQVILLQQGRNITSVPNIDILRLQTQFKNAKLPIERVRIAKDLTIDYDWTKIPTDAQFRLASEILFAHNANDKTVTPDEDEIGRIEKLEEVSQIKTNSPFRIQTEIEFYRNSQTPLNGNTSKTPWFSGIALSASMHVINAMNNWLIGSKITYARWVVAWNPNTNTDVKTGLLLVTADSGPTNILEVARIEHSNYMNPRVDAVDVTSVLNGMIQGGVWKQIGQQTFGNATTGPLVYSSTIEVIWEKK